jgi:hypothetical protein
MKQGHGAHPQHSHWSLQVSLGVRNSLQQLRDPLCSVLQDIFYINFGAWHRKNSADWATFIPALEALGKDYQVSVCKGL